MINQKELKIGNIVHSTVLKGKVEIVGIGRYVNIRKLGTTIINEVNVSDIKGIPISEESLDGLYYSHNIFDDEERKIIKRKDGKFEFSIADYGYVLSELKWRGDWSMGIEYYDSPNEDFDGVVLTFLGEGLKHIHQLQNLFFSLQNNELKHKDK